jgi:hypothetical protein
MNSKHIACALVAILIALLVQFTLWFQNSRSKMQREAAAAQQAEVTAAAVLARERIQLGELRRQSAGLIDFLNTWQPYFQSLDNPQSAEVNYSMRVKEANLVNLAQRFEQVSLKGNSSFPTAMRAYLTFEDDYARLLNWLGDLETKMPTARISSIRLSKGTRANDLRMELMLEHPLLRK